jgi:hypothetical protein
MSEPQVKRVEEPDRQFLLEYYKSKIGEHMTYWITASITLLTVQQLKITWIFIIGAFLYGGFSIFTIGRIFYWELHSVYLMGLVDYIDIKDEHKYTVLDLIHNALYIKIKKGDPKHTNTLRRRFGKLFMNFNTLLIVMVISLLVSLAVLLYGCSYNLF